MQHLITVTYSGGVFTYVDSTNGQHNPGPAHHVKNHDTMQWICPNHDIRVEFPHGTPTHDHVPLDAHAGHPTASIGLTGSGTCKYDVILTIDSQSRRDDPQILFDDGMTDVGREHMQAIEDSFREISATLFRELQANLAFMRGTEPALFPQGINLIAFDIDAKVVKLTIKVAGPGVSGLTQ